MHRVDPTRIRDLIKKRGFTFIHVANSCFIEYQTLFHILGGRHNPSERVIKLLAMVLQTSPEFLAGKSDDPKEVA